MAITNSNTTPGGTKEIMLARFRDKLRDPIFFCKRVLGIEFLTTDQLAIIESYKKNRYTAVTSGQGTGKSFLCAALLLHFLFSERDSIVVTTAPTWHLVENVLWREVKRLLDGAKVPLGGDLTKTRLDIDSKWYAVGLSTNDATRFQGAHSGRVLVIMDEATGIDKSIFEGTEAITLGPKDRIIAIGNPTDASSAFYSECMKRDKWNVLEISCLNHPNVKEGKEVIKGAISREWVEGKRQEWGEESPLWESRVLGKWSKRIGFMWPEFDPAAGGRHVYDPSSIKLETWFKRWISIDWGFSHPCAVLFYCFDGKRVYVEDELLIKEMTAREIGEIIGRRYEKMKETTGKFKFDKVVLSFDAFNKMGYPRSRAEEMWEGMKPFGLPFPHQSSRDRIGGWNLISSMLRSDLLVVSKKCGELITGIKAAVRDEKRPEDVLKQDGDDSIDSLKYGLQTHQSSILTPLEVKIDERTKEAREKGDFMAAQIQRMMVEAEAKKHAIPRRVFRRISHRRMA